MRITNLQRLEKRVLICARTLLFYLPFRREGERELRTPVLSYELTQADAPNWAINVLLKLLMTIIIVITDIVITDTIMLILLAICQPVH